jgi:hypothetical protein
MGAPEDPVHKGIRFPGEREHHGDSDNDLGHPREVPPAVTQEDAFVNLQVFPRYYQTAEEVRAFFATNKV